MANMRAIMPALQKATASAMKTDAIKYAKVQLPQQQRQTRIVKDMSVDDIAKEIVAWIRG